MSQIIEDLELKIANTARDLVGLQAQLLSEKEKSPDKLLASELHGLVCTHNHTDGCGWFYEFNGKEDDWRGWAHGEYLKKAQKLIHLCDKEGVSTGSALRMFKAVRGY